MSPVSSCTSRAAVCAGVSSQCNVPVTDCQKPAGVTRSSSRQSRACVWMITRTDSGRRSSQLSAAFVSRIPTSLSCAGLASLGALVRRSLAVCVFGNAMTSRILSAPAMIMTRRSSPKRYAAMRRTAVIHRGQQKTELGFGFFLSNSKQIEDGRLHLGVVDTNRAASDLRAVQYHVISTRERGAGIAAKFFRGVRLRRSKRMMRRRPAAFAVIIEYGEIDDPTRLPAASSRPRSSASRSRKRRGCR